MNDHVSTENNTDINKFINQSTDLRNNSDRFI